MKKYCFISVLLLLACFAQSNSSEVGIVTFVTGTATLTREGQEPRPVVVDDRVMKLDTIETSTNGRVRVVFYESALQASVLIKSEQKKQIAEYFGESAKAGNVKIAKEIIRILVETEGDEETTAGIQSGLSQNNVDEKTEADDSGAELDTESDESMGMVQSEMPSGSENSVSFGRQSVSGNAKSLDLQVSSKQDETSEKEEKSRGIFQSLYDSIFGSKVMKARQNKEEMKKKMEQARKKLDEASGGRSNLKSSSSSSRQSVFAKFTAGKRPSASKQPATPEEKSDTEERTFEILFPRGKIFGKVDRFQIHPESTEPCRAKVLRMNNKVVFATPENGEKYRLDYPLKPGDYIFEVSLMANRKQVIQTVPFSIPSEDERKTIQTELTELEKQFPDPGDPTIHLMKGALFSKHGYHLDAAAEYRIYLQSQSNSRIADRLLMKALRESGIENLESQSEK